MATKVPNTVLFMSKLLAPLAPDEVQPNDDAYMRELKEETRGCWWMAWRKAERAFHLAMAADSEGCTVRVRKLEATWDRTNALSKAATLTLINAIDDAMSLAVTTKADATDKGRRLRAWTKPICGTEWLRIKPYMPQWEAAVEADRARLGMTGGAA